MVKKKRMGGYFLLSKSKRRGVLIAIGIMTVLCLMMSCALINYINIEEVQAVSAGASKVEIGDILLNNYESRTDKNVFDGDKLYDLYSKLLKDDDANYEKIETAAATPMTSADFRNNNGGKVITLEMGGYEWNAVYLSTNRSGEPILTLWMASSAIKSKYSNFVNINNGAYPSNMYSSSYIRTEMLNNTGTHYTSLNGGGAKEYTQSPTHQYFAKFTSDAAEGSLTKFIDAPEMVEWQEKQLSHKYNGWEYDFNNDAYGDVGSGGGDNANWYSGMVNYYGKGDADAGSNYDAWKTDKLWLPSMAESGWNMSQSFGIWQTSAVERGNAAGIGSWQRSASHPYYQSGRTLTADGTLGEYPNVNVASSYAVRPAMHLNLKKVNESATIANIEPKGEAKQYYNSAVTHVFELNKIATDKVEVSLTAEDMDGNAMASPAYKIEEGVLTFDAKEVGKYVVKVKPKDGEIWTDGSNTEKTYTYIVKYHVTPLLIASDVSGLVYKGHKQYIELENYDSSKMTVSPSSGGTLEQIPSGESAGAMSISAVNAGEYSVKVSLKNTEFMEWTDNDTSTPKSMSFNISKKTLTVTTSGLWSTEVYTSKEYELELDCAVEDIGKLRFEGCYRFGSGEEKRADVSPAMSATEAKVTVKLPRLSEKGTYTYILKLADGITANGNYTLSYSNNFSVGNKRIDLSDGDIVWRYANSQIDGGKYQEVNGLDADGVFNLDYNGYEYSFQVDLVQLSEDVRDSIEYEYVGEESGSDVLGGDGIYTAKFKIRAKDGNTSIDIVTSEFTLKWRINKAKLDLSKMKWNYSRPYQYNDKNQEVVMTGVPNGVTLAYKDNRKITVGTYTAKVLSVTLTGSMQNNYIRPDINDSSTYIGDVEWELEWKIDKGVLDLEWERKEEEDGAGKTYMSWEASNTDKVEYRYYTEKGYAGGAMTGAPIDKSEITVPDEEIEVEYWIVAVLKDGYINNYEIKSGTEAMPFTVGSTSPIISIKMEREYVYDGKAHGGEWYDSAIPGMGYVKAKYYEVKGEEEILLDGAPSDAGKYVVRFEIEEEYQESYQLSAYKKAYEILKAEIEISIGKSEYVYDGASKGGEFSVASNNYDISKIIKKYYRGSEINEGNRLGEGEMPVNAGEYVIALTISEEDLRNYELKEGSGQFGLKINKAQITAVWNTGGNVPVISDPSGAYGEVIGYIYYDENGNELEDGAKLEVGKKYMIKAVILGENAANYEFVSESGEIISEDGAESERKEFTVSSGGNNGGNIGGIDDNDKDNDKDGTSFDKVLATLKEWWQVIASGASIILILIFTGKGIGYASKRKENKKTIESKYRTYYAGLFSLSMKNWNIIAGVLMGVAVLSLVFMLIEKRGYKKSVRELDDAKEEYQRNREETMYMRMMGGNGNGAQGYGYAQPSLEADEIRGIVSEAMTAMLPNMQQYLPQQASANDELVQKLIEQNEMLMDKLSEQNADSGNDEIIRQLMEQNAKNEEKIERLMEKLSEQSAEKAVKKETAVILSENNDDIIKSLVDGQKEIMDRLSAGVVRRNNVVEKLVEVEKSDDRIDKLMRNQETLMKQMEELKADNKGSEKIVEKEVRVEVPVEKIVMVSAAKPAPKAKAVSPRLTLDEAYEKLSAKQKKFFDTLRDYAMSKDKCKEKKSTYNILLGQSSVNPLVKLTVKKNTTVAMFKMEDEYMKDIRRNATSDGTKVKVKETELIVGDAQALATAKEMIDLREDQIERYNEYLKEQRSMKRK